LEVTVIANGCYGRPLTVAYAAVKEPVDHHIQNNRKIGTGEIVSDMITMWWMNGLRHEL
jgi:hypothetical protein